MRHDPGLAASPPVRYILEVERWVTLLSTFRPLWTDNLLAKQRRTAVRRPRRISYGPTDAAAEREVLHPHQQGRPERRRERRHAHGVRRRAARALGGTRQMHARHRARRRRHHLSREPDRDCSSDDVSSVDGGELVVAGGQAGPLFVVLEGSLDDVASPRTSWHRTPAA